MTETTKSQTKETTQIELITEVKAHETDWQNNSKITNILISLKSSNFLVTPPGY